MKGGENMSTVIKMSNETINANQTTVKTTTKKNSADIYSTNAYIAYYITAE